MSKLIFLFSVCVAFLTGTSVTLASAGQQAKEQSADELFAVISSLDGAVFDAFNNCSSPEQLKKHAGFFAPDVEFYHDTGGVTWNRHDMITNTAKYACGNYRRELVAGSLKVFPVKGFGAIVAHRQIGGLTPELRAAKSERFQLPLWMVMARLPHWGDDRS